MSSITSANDLMGQAELDRSYRLYQKEMWNISFLKNIIAAIKDKIVANPTTPTEWYCDLLLDRDTIRSRINESFNTTKAYKLRRRLEFLDTEFVIKMLKEGGYTVAEHMVDITLLCIYIRTDTIHRVSIQQLEKTDKCSPYPL